MKSPSDTDESFTIAATEYHCKACKKMTCWDIFGVESDIEICCECGAMRAINPIPYDDLRRELGLNEASN